MEAGDRVLEQGKCGSQPSERCHAGIVYIATSFVLWLVVEYVTVWHARLAEWVALMPLVLVQYLVIVLVFWVFLFWLKWTGSRSLILLVAVMYVFEFLWRNPLLLNAYTFLPASLLLISIWGFLSLVPFWFATGTLRCHKVQVALFLLWLPVGFVAAIVSELMGK